MNPHESYEILCAVAASGRASAEEREKLSSHIEECEECCARLRDFAQLSAQALPFHASRYSEPEVPGGMNARFVERVRAEGVAFHQPAAVVRWWAFPSLLRWSSAVTVLVLLVAVLGTKELWKRYRSPAPLEPIAAHIAPVAQTQDRMAIQIPSPQPGQPSVDLDAELLAAESMIGELKRQIEGLQKDLAGSRSKEGSSAMQLSAIEKENKDLRLEASQKDAQLAELDRQLGQKDSFAKEDIANLVEKQTKLEQVSSELEKREREVARERQLLAASAQARDLITARNLHIIDVHDNDRAGRQRPFGRIFYTEGRSLIFYAYDLDSADHRAKLAFHVWGGTLGDQKRVQNLGIFRNEDAASGRWVLTFDDARVMAQINTVFVTAEFAQDKLAKPRGKHILYAFLGDQPNHP